MCIRDSPQQYGGDHEKTALRHTERRWSVSQIVSIHQERLRLQTLSLLQKKEWMHLGALSCVCLLYTSHIPSDKELSYRSYLILDEATMSYNMGYGDNGGCTYHKTAEELYEWYQYWKTPDRFYAYIQRDKDHAFIGEVSLHKNERNDWFEMGIIIEAKYRGMGYSVPALNLLDVYKRQSIGVVR